MQGAFLKAGYYDDYWPHRAEALSAYLKRAIRSRWSTRRGTRTEEGAVGAENSNAVYTAVECNDASWPTDFEGLGPGQYAAGAPGAVRGVMGQRVDEPAVRLLAGAPAAPSTCAPGRVSCADAGAGRRAGRGHSATTARWSCAGGCRARCW
ncbi:hypothetical protein LV779_10365 [Streptomyces thinghirensis]|nr:hypothetical protein [Streptomyces thinghirensis]